ncbi:hypothetical protein CR513_38240, partial [Mucuna pruriens]
MEDRHIETEIEREWIFTAKREKRKIEKERARVVSQLSGGLKGILLARIMEDDNVYNHIASEIHASTLWEKIESLYASSKCGNNKLFSLNSIVNLKFKEGTSLSDHLNEFQGIINQMSRMGIKFEDEILGLLLLNSLLESWETFKISIANSIPNGIVSLQMVKGSILNEEMRRKAQGSSSQSEVLVTTNRGRSEKRKEKRVEENKGKKDKSKEKDDDDDDDHDHVTTATGDDLIILRDFESVNFVSDESMWIIDSGATLHVTPRKEFFTSYTTSDFGVLKIGNDGVTKVIGVGDVCLQTNTGMQLWLRGVKHAPD